MRILEKLWRNCISFLRNTQMESPFPKSPIKTVIGVTTTSMMLAKESSIISVNKKDTSLDAVSLVTWQDRNALISL